MRNPLLRGPFWVAIALLTLASASVSYYAGTLAYQREVESRHHLMLQLARILAEEWKRSPNPPSPAEWVQSAAARSGSAVTITGANGSTVAQSSGPKNADSSTAETIEVSIPLPGESLPGKAGPAQTLTLSASTEEARQAAARLQLRATWGIAAFAAAVLAVVTIYLHFTALRIRRLRRFAERMLDLPAAVAAERDPKGDDDLGALARSLGRIPPVMRDLESRSDLESALRESILASLAEGVLAVDHQLRATFCNDSFARLFGLPIPVAPGQHLVTLVRDPALTDLLTDVLESGIARRTRLELTMAETRQFEVQTIPFRHGSMNGAIAVLHDITELERLERIRKDFVANVSHELRTPLTAISGYAETLLEGGLEDAEHRRPFLEIIQRNAIRLNNIASDLLTLSEIEGTKPAEQPASISVSAAIQSALRTVESEAKMRGVRLVCEQVEDVCVSGLRIRFEQALVNLLHNAVKFNKAGGEVRLSSEASENEWVRISVADTGIGIPSDEIPRIFERFYRVDKARSRAVGGTGLGLSIVKHAVEQMDGKIVVESQLGKGSKFTILLKKS